MKPATQAPSTQVCGVTPIAPTDNTNSVVKTESNNLQSGSESTPSAATATATATTAAATAAAAAAASSCNNTNSTNPLSSQQSSGTPSWHCMGSLMYIGGPAANSAAINAANGIQNTESTMISIPNHVRKPSLSSSL